MIKKLHSKRFVNGEYIDEGSGQALFLLHGFGEDVTLWQTSIDFLKPNYRVLATNFPGTGNPILPEEPTRMEMLADYIFEIIQQEHLDSILLIGHSMGGYVALSFAEKYPAMVVGISLVHSSAFADDEEKKANRLKAIRILEKDGKENFLQTMIPALYAEQTKKNNPAILQAHLTMATTIPSATLIRYYEAMIHRTSKIEFIKHTQIPMQFIIGKEDMAIPFSISMQQCHLPSISKIDILENVGHMGMLESTTSFLTILNSFCKYIVAPKKPLNL
jgi:pimeloyl-ACP methyl ester carboxylesterase